MSVTQSIITIAAVVAGTMLTRFIPFLVFPERKRTPKSIEFLGTILPFAMTGLLVVYSLKDTVLTACPYGIPQAIAVILVVVVHWWKHNMMLSLAAGTIAYMILIQTVFA
ncbi:branched-chain amino acid permease [Galliscardovia ingluviei]|uniref:Branched-chain amino acid permease n=1 Tax=Galliscardovia ingluviei TaxID=1769422 RepID=A0A8J3AFI2_9BIFI|nr:AzlD domain-containing protein [Galliscardovia ingluviei]GGI12944.1 branched-chain amino acid permease [Galliscardovia ingluviei]